MELKTNNLIECALKWSAPNLTDGLLGKRGTNKLRSAPKLLLEYENLFKDKKLDQVNLLEIGVAFGGSLGMWKDYFSNGVIYGLDRNEFYKNTMSLPVFFKEAPSHIKKVMIESSIPTIEIPLYVSLYDYAEENIIINIINSTNKKRINKNYEDNFFDIIIEDASHILAEQVKTFCNFYPKLKEGGIYVIEDIHLDNLKEFKNIFNKVDYKLVMDHHEQQGHAIFKKEKDFDCNLIGNQFKILKRHLDAPLKEEWEAEKEFERLCFPFAGAFFIRNSEVCHVFVNEGEYFIFNDKPLFSKHYVEKTLQNFHALKEKYRENVGFHTYIQNISNSL